MATGRGQARRTASMEDIARELRRLEEEKGRLRPEDVVDAARDPSSPLHKHFEWDDAAAAHRHRLDQARSLIRRVTVEVVVRNVPLTVPQFVRDPESPAKEAGYRSTMSIRGEEDVARAAIVEEMKRVANAVRRAKSLAAVLGMESDIAEIDNLASAVAARAMEGARA